MALSFFFIAAALVCIAVIAIVPVLLKKQAPGDRENRQQKNVFVARQRLDDLKQRKSLGEVQEEDARQIHEEIERSLLEDLGSEHEEFGEDSIVDTNRRSRWAAVIVIFAIPFFAGGMYLLLGEPSVIVAPFGQQQSAASGEESTSVDETIRQVRDQLLEEPDNVGGWVTLGQALASQSRFEDAAIAFARANELVGDNADLLVSHADALAMSRGGNLEGEPAELVRRALAVDPEHPAALWLAGLAENTEGNYREAVELWKRAVLVVPNPELKEELKNLIEIAESRIGTTGRETGPIDEGDEVALEVTVSIDPSLASNLNPDDTLYIFARAVDGPPMPLAVVKKTVKDLPVTVKLDDSSAMMPEMKLSNFDEVNVIARVSRSGQPQEQSGDLFGRVDSVRTREERDLTIKISETVR